MGIVWNKKNWRLGKQIARLWICVSVNIRNEWIAGWSVVDVITIEGIRTVKLPLWFNKGRFWSLSLDRHCICFSIAKQ